MEYRKCPRIDNTLFSVSEGSSLNFVFTPTTSPINFLFYFYLLAHYDHICPLIFSISCIRYHGTCANRVLRVTLRLVEMRVSTKRWPGHPRFNKKKKRYNLRAILIPVQSTINRKCFLCFW